MANEVIGSIAAMAALEVDGVTGVDGAAARHKTDFLMRDGAHAGVRVAVDQERSIHLEVFIRVDAGRSIREVAERVPENVVEAVERMLELSVAEANIVVSGVSFGG